MGVYDFDWDAEILKRNLEEKTGLDAHVLAELSEDHFNFCAANKDRISVRRMGPYKFEFWLKDRKLVFFYNRFCKGYGNIKSFKRCHGSGFIINQLELNGFIGEIKKRPKIKEKYIKYESKNN